MLDYEETMELGAGRRLSLAADALWLESRGPGGAWIRSRQVGYDTIRLVYSYELGNRQAAVATGITGGLLAAACLVTAAAMGAGGAWVLGTGLLLGAAAGGGAFWLDRTPRRLMRIDTIEGTLIVPNNAPFFFRRLAERLPVPDAREPGSESGPRGDEPGAEGGEPGPVDPGAAS